MHSYIFEMKSIDINPFIVCIFNSNESVVSRECYLHEHQNIIRLHLSPRIRWRWMRLHRYLMPLFCNHFNHQDLMDRLTGQNNFSLLQFSFYVYDFTDLNEYKGNHILVTWMLHARTPTDPMFVNATLGLMEMVKTAQMNLISLL